MSPPLSPCKSRSSERPKKPLRGRKGDPRMRQAVYFKLDNPTLGLSDALRMAGFTFTNAESENGTEIGPDGVSIAQRKNQLCRRVREERKRREQELKPVSATSASGNKREPVKLHLKRKFQRMNDEVSPDKRCGSDTASKTGNCVTTLPPPTIAASETNEGMMGFELNEEGGGLGLDFMPDTFTVDPASCHVFTAEEIEREEAEMTDEERAASFADLHGKGPSSKWFRLLEYVTGRAAPQEPPQEMLPKPIRSLRAEVRAEVEAIQRGEGGMPAVDVDLASAVRSETDDRLELFLLREEMNAKRAATRLVKYWMKRFELFGAEKFNLPMSLNGALRGDDAQVALATGTIRIMPDLDAYGRTVVYRANCHHTLKGYSTSSMIRAWWYMYEALLEDPNTRKGIVLITWGRHTTLWNYDAIVDTAAAQFEREFLPIQFSAIHCTGLDGILIHLLKPVFFGLMDKRIRSRTWFYYESGSRFFDALRRRGISRDVLPVEMGGNNQFSHSVWLEERRASGK